MEKKPYKLYTQMENLPQSVEWWFLHSHLSHSKCQCPLEPHIHPAADKEPGWLLSNPTWCTLEPYRLFSASGVCYWQQCSLPVKCLGVRTADFQWGSPQEDFFLSSLFSVPHPLHNPGLWAALGHELCAVKLVWTFVPAVSIRECDLCLVPPLPKRLRFIDCNLHQFGSVFL